MQRVENAAPERHQRDEQKIGKGDAGERDRQLILLRLAREAGRQQIDRLRREEERERQQHDLRREQQREDAVAEYLGRVLPLLGANARIGGDERGVERAFGEDRAEMVGQAKGDEKGVGDRAGAQDRRQHDVAEKAGNARKQRIAADRENPLDHGCFVTIDRSSPRKRGPREFHRSDARSTGFPFCGNARSS